MFRDIAHHDRRNGREAKQHTTKTNVSVIVQDTPWNKYNEPPVQERPANAHFVRFYNIFQHSWCVI